MIDLDIKISTTFPVQKKSLREKDEEWRKRCIDACISKCLQYLPRRSTPRSKQVNYDLLNGKFDKREFNYVTNPYCVEGEDFEFPASLEFFDIISPLFNLLFGEEIKRIFTPIAVVVNEDAISEKEDAIKNEVMQMFQELLKGYMEGSDTSALEEKLSKFSSYNYQDMRERLSNHLLKYYSKYCNVDKVFQDGWLDALVAGEEIYKVEILGRDLKVRRVNPIYTYFALPNNSAELDEADTIVEERYMSYSEIIDEFYDILTEQQIDEIENMSASQAISTSYNMGFPIVPPGQNIDSIYALEANNFQRQGLKVWLCTWKSKKKVGVLTTFDDKGNLTEDIVSEFYKPDKNELIEWMWINEYWSGIKIGDMYINVKPNPNQFRRMDNIAMCKSGYVGTIYNCQNSQSVSLMDRIKPWLYMYIKLWYRTELLIAANQGKIAKIDLAMIPDGWELEKWLYYASAMKFAFVDSFNEGKKGAATGKLAGNMSGQSGEIDLETGNSIQHNISLLQYVEEKLMETSGITKQRLGAISTSELVGNTERAVTQSSHITEKWFEVHNQTKVRVLEMMLETAKVLLQGKSKKFQYITDDIASIFFTVDGDAFANADYGVFISNSARDIKALATLEGLMMTAIQYDKASLADVLDVMNSQSIADLKNRLKASEAQRMQQAQQNEQMQMQMNQQAQQAQQQMEQAKLELEKYKIDTDNQTKIQVAEIGVYARQQELDQNANGVPDPLEIGAQALEERKHASESMSKQLELTLKQKELQDRKDLEEKKLKNQKEIEDKKLEQIKVQNQNQIQLKQMDAKMKEKELEAKAKIERIKARNKPKAK
jgi:hypothetical protein